jgi:hypothetical protein
MSKCYYCGAEGVLTKEIRDMNILGHIAKDIEDEFFQCPNNTCVDDEGGRPEWYNAGMMDATTKKAYEKLGWSWDDRKRPRRKLKEQ